MAHKSDKNRTLVKKARKSDKNKPTLKEFQLPDQIREMVDVKEEDGKVAKAIHQISDEKKVVLLAFVAPYASVRISPIEERSAAVRMPEEWGIEYALSQIECKCDKTDRRSLYLLINSPGGIPACCYNIAHMIQGCFSHIKVFVPQVALSGGTLLALSGNSLVMGTASRLSPIDIQVPYGESRVSAYSMGKALSRLEKYFSTKTVDEAPYPYRAMADKLDPVILEDWTTALREIAGYAGELMEAVGYLKETQAEIIKALVLTDNTHSYVVHRERAKSLGLNISDEGSDLDTLNVMREWLAEYAFAQGATHFIRFVVPKRSKPDEKSADEADEAQS